MAHGLAGLGVTAGDHVGVALRDSLEHVEVMLACYKLRAVPVNVSYRYVADEVAYLCRDAGLVALVSARGQAGATMRRTGRAPDRGRRRIRAVLPTGALGYEDAPFRNVGGARLRSPFGRRPVRALHRRHHRPPEGRRLAAGGHLLRRARRREPGGPADRGCRRRSGPACSPTRPVGSPHSSPPGDAEARRSSRSRPGRSSTRAGSGRPSGRCSAGARSSSTPSRTSMPSPVLDLVASEHIVALNLVGDAVARPLVEQLEAHPGRVGHVVAAAARIGREHPLGRREGPPARRDAVGCRR